MDLSDLTKATTAQEKGHEFELLDPVHGEGTGIKITIAGPDSERSRTARLALAKANARLTRKSGTVPPEQQEGLMDAYLFAVTIDWNVKEDGKAIPFNEENFKRLLRAGNWVRGQIDLFAGSRAPYFKAGA